MTLCVSWAAVTARSRRGPRSRPLRPPASTPSRSTSSSACPTSRLRRGGASWRRPPRSGPATSPAISSRSTRAPASASPRSAASCPRCPRASRPFSSRSRTVFSPTRATPRTRSRTSRAAATTSRATTASTGTTRPTSGSAPRRTRSPPPTQGAPAARRWWNELRTPRWESRVAAGERPVEAEESLGPKALATEAVMLGLRTTAGIDLDGFTSRYGVDLLAANAALVDRPRGRGPPRRARRPGRWPLAGADGDRTGRCRRHGRRVRDPFPELTRLATPRPCRADHPTAAPPAVPPRARHAARVCPRWMPRSRGSRDPLVATAGRDAHRQRGGLKREIDTLITIWTECASHPSLTLWLHRSVWTCCHGSDARGTRFLGRGSATQSGAKGSRTWMPAIVRCLTPPSAAGGGSRAGTEGTAPGRASCAASG